MAIDHEEVFGYPFRGDDAVTRFLIGGGIPSLLVLAFAVLTVLSLVLPLIGVLNLLLYPVGFAIGLCLTGYYVRIVRETYTGGDEPPAFDEWGALLRDGGYGFLIALVYTVPLIAVTVGVTVLSVLVVGGGAALGGGETESMFAALGVISMLVLAVLSLLSMLYALVASYLFPISLCIYADTDDLRKSFSKERLLAVARSGEYAVPWLVQVGVLFAIQTFVGLLTIILIGYLLYPFLPFAFFFVSTAGFYAFAQAYDAAIDGEQTVTERDGRSAV